MNKLKQTKRILAIFFMVFLFQSTSSFFEAKAADAACVVTSEGYLDWGSMVDSAGSTGATANGFIDPITNQLKITGTIPFITTETITKIFTAGEESGPLPGRRFSFDQTVNPQADTSGEKSAANTSPYFGGGG